MLFHQQTLNGNNLNLKKIRNKLSISIIILIYTVVSFSERQHEREPVQRKTRNWQLKGLSWKKQKNEQNTSYWTEEK